MNRRESRFKLLIYLQKLCGMAFWVLARVSLEHGLGHVVHAHHEVGSGQEGLGVHCDIVVQSGHHIAEVIKPIALEHCVHHLQEKALK